MPRGDTLPRTLPALLCSLLFATPALADNWPRFQGPNGTGTASDKNVPVKFAPNDGILWKLELPGLGNSSPVIWGDRLFLQAAPRDGLQRVVFCVSIKEGKILWERSFAGKPPPPKKLHQKNTVASCTAATDGERVFVPIWDGDALTLHAFDVDGKPLWEHKFGKFVSQHGPGASPVIHGDKVFFANDSDTKSVLYAFDSRTGKVAWQKTRPYYRACYSSPLLREGADGKPELVLVSTMAITGYDPESGRENWGYTWKFAAKMPLRTTGSPAYAGGMLFCVSGDGGGDRHAIALKLDDSGGKTKPALAWENRKDFPYVPCPLAHGAHVYFVNDKGMAGCYEQKTGKRLWLERLDDTTFASSPVLIDGKVYAASEDGDVYVFAAEPKFRLLAKNSLGEPVRASPAVADGKLFVRGQNHLYCIGKR
jgi:outer membrane protein assembly factor BamB